jgi:invasion protein IalB
MTINGKKITELENDTNQSVGCQISVRVGERLLDTLQRIQNNLPKRAILVESG